MTERDLQQDAQHATEPDRRQDPVEAVERRRRRAQVFGDVLPDSTSDERADGGSGRDRAAGSAPADDDWLRSQVPPHHG